MNRKHKDALMLTIMIILLIALIFISMTLGRYPISLKEICGILGSHFVKIDSYWTTMQETLLLNHRLPRILLACIVGCALSTAGAAYQGTFQNPMASPDILGASAGAGFGAALAILLNMSSAWIVAFAFIFSLLCVILVLIIGKLSKGNQVLGLILAGIMISSLFSSGTSFIKLIADTNDQLPAITYWMMGSLNGATLDDVAFAIIPMLIGLIPLYLLRWRINILTLNEDEARSMGINVALLRVIIILCSTLITATAVSVSGVIGWIGLVIPHLMRRLVGNNYQYLLPASMLGGAIFLLLVDNISRNLLLTEIPIGILTSFIGAPFFISLVIRREEQL